MGLRQQRETRQQGKQRYMLKTIDLVGGDLGPPASPERAIYIHGSGSRWRAGALGQATLDADHRVIQNSLVVIPVINFDIAIGGDPQKIVYRSALFHTHP